MIDCNISKKGIRLLTSSLSKMENLNSLQLALEFNNIGHRTFSFFSKELSLL